MMVLITLFFSVYGLLFGIAISVEKYVLDMTSFCGTLIMTCRWMEDNRMGYNENGEL